ncbi:hypothetical protein [Arthrobacter sp. NPDC057013]|uniref:hypothetical protein n=1 Tax=Arthrobacter sp. NPDC057013 TaxID=3345999 RepID=UPI003642B1A3
MTPNHQQLRGLLIAVDPGFVAGRFATEFTRQPGLVGETGSFTYFGNGFWDVRFEGAGRELSAPWGMRIELESGLVEEAPRRRTPPRRPPSVHGVAAPLDLPGPRTR